MCYNKHIAGSELCVMLCGNSPDGSILCCGTTPANEEDKSMLYFYDISASSPSSVSSGSDAGDSRKEVRPFLGIGVASGCSAIYTLWQAKTNQIICR